MPYESVIETVLLKQLDKAPDDIFIYWGDDEHTYKNVYEMSNRAADYMLEQGLKKGGKVAMFMHNSIEYVYAWLGVTKVGGIIVPVNPALVGDGLHYIINNSGATTLICDEELCGRLNLAEIPKVDRLLISMRESGDALPRPGDSGKIIPAGFMDEISERSIEKPRIDWDIKYMSTESILYTSGTTGLPKGVVMPHGRFHLSQGLAAGSDPDDTTYVFLPLFHIAGQNMAVGAIFCGGRIKLKKKFSASDFEPDCRKFGVTGFIVTGGIIPIIMKTYEGKPPPGFGLKKVLCAAPWSKFDKEFRERYKVQEFMKVYTTTEGGAVLISDPKTPDKAIGRQFMGITKIFDDNDNELGPGEIGELVFRPSKRAPAKVNYHDNAEASEKKTHKGWQRSGDLFMQDDKGYFYFVDRKDHWIRRRGENISPAEIENELQKHPQIKEAAAVPVPSEIAEDEVLAFIVLQDGVSLEPQEILDFLKGKLQDYAIPRYIAFREDLPKTGTERTQKFILQNEVVAEGHVDPSIWDANKVGSNE